MEFIRVHSVNFVNFVIGGRVSKSGGVRVCYYRIYGENVDVSCFIGGKGVIYPWFFGVEFVAGLIYIHQ